MVEATLKYHILTEPVPMTSITKGDSIWASTALRDPALSNVTGGQRLILTKQPGGEVVFTSGFATRGTVMAEDLAFDGGLVQIIDSVMRVPESLESTARNAYTDLTSFVGALYAAGLAREVMAQKDVTIFAPSNAAFQRLAGTLEAMDRDRLRNVLRYHVVPGAVTHAWELQNATWLTTAADRPGDGDGGDGGDGSRARLHVTRHVNSVYANSAEIIQADVLIANGLVHLVDNVLNPDRPGARPALGATPQPPVFKPAGPTATGTGTAAPTPFASNLPCIAATGCPGDGGAATGSGDGDGGGAAGSAGAAGARFTGWAGAALGLAMAAGALMVVGL